jgi:CubicO group peptidase (beta-lactamase class C family)
MLRRTLLLVCSAALACPAQDLTAKVDDYLNGQKFSGSVLLAKGGKILVSKGYRMANYELDVPNKPDTKFRLGSITKQFTGAAVLQLQEKGKLNVDDLVSKYVSDTPQAWKDITIHHLLTHTSGLHGYTELPDYRKRQRELVTPAELISRFKDLPLDFAPGSKWRYSNSGYSLLGYIIEKVSGQSYESFLKENIFDRLDMRDSGYDHAAALVKNRASGYAERPTLANAEFLDMSIPYSAGSLYSTVEDLYRWDRALYTDKALSEKSRQRMFTPLVKTTNGVLSYGYGWMIGTENGRKVIQHGGGINGFVTVILRYPDQDACVIVLSNIPSPRFGPIGLRLAVMLLDQ